MELKELRCPTCGIYIDPGKIDFSKKIGRCHACYGTFVIEQAENFAVDVDEIRASRITSLRQNLERAVKKDDGQEMLLYSGKIREMLPDDYEANYFYAYAKAKAGDSRYLYEFYQDDEKDRTPDSENIIVDHVIEHGDFRDKKRIEEFLRGLKSEDEEEFLTRLEKTFAERLKKEEYYDDVERDVFVCYSSIRQDVADRVVNILEKDGNTCWIASRNLRPNDNENYWKDIGKAIRSCRIFLVISSDEAQQSKDVKREIGLAEELQKRRIEIKIDDVPHTTLFKRFFDGCKWVNGENYDEIKTRVADLVAKAMRGDNGVIVRKVEKVKYAPIREAEQPTAKIVLDEFHKHEFVKGEVVPPTCKEPGFTVYRCECGEMKKSDFTARRTEHDFVLAEKKEPTCTDDGYVKYECKYCDATKTDAIPALGHDFKLKEVKDSTCIKKGYRFFTCGRCGEKKWEELPLIEHTFSDWKITKFPSCEEAGEETRQCSFCGKTESRALQPTGHSYGKWITKKEPTCTENGIKVCRCQTCGKEEEKAIEAKGHTFGDWYTLPTDVTKDERICKECGYSETRLKAEVKEKKLNVWSLVLVVFSLACLVGMIICWGVFIFDGYHYLAVLPITLGALAVVSAVAVFIVYCRKKVAGKLIKIGSVFLLVVTVGLTVGVGVHTAVTEKVDYYKQFFLAEIDNGYEIKRLRTNIDQVIEIPSEIKGKPVVSIADNAFSDCSSLTSITIPDSVTSIGNNAFSNCSNLTSITLDNSVTSIGQSAFEGCSSLTSITIPDSVTSIGGRAFYECSNLTSITIPDSVTSIGEEAFNNCSRLTSITLGNSVTSIGQSAFEGCSSLTSVTIGNSVTSIGNNAFSNCPIEKATIPAIACSYVKNSNLKTVEITSGESIGEEAFYNCSRLTSITIPDSVTSIEEEAFNNCSRLTSITIPNSVTSIGSSVFRGCSGLTSVTIGNSVTSIGSSAFRGCSGLTSVTIGNSVTSIGNNAFSNCPIEKATIPALAISYIPKSNLKTVVITSGESIESNAFYNCSSLTSVTIGNSVTSIGDDAFSYCSSLTSITIPDSVTNIGQHAFSNCPIEKATIPAIACSYVKNSNLKTVVITSGESIESSAFYNCSNLTSITLGNSITSIGESAFEGCSSLQYNEYDNGYYLGNDNNPYIILVKAKGTSITSCTIHENTKFIHSSAFSNCSSLTSITIPFVGSRAGATSSDTYQYPFGYIFGTSSYTGGTATTQYYYGSSTTSTTNTTYYIPSTLKSVTVTGGNIPYGAFYNCSSLMSITIPDSVTSIGDYAFDDCSSLTSITIPDSVTSIGNYAFSNCSILTSVTIGDGVTSIGSEAFRGCRSLTSVTIGSGVTSIGNNAFSNCPIETATIPAIACSYVKNSNLETVEITSGESIGEEAFYNCSNLTSITIGNSVTSIGSGAFRNCSSLTRITIPDSVTSIGSYAFSDCSRLTRVYYTGNIASWCGITFGDNPLEYAHNLYINNELIKDIVIPDMVTEIKKYAFSGWNGTSITIPDSVTSIGYRAFYNCSSLTSVTIGNSVTSIGDDAFSYCSSLTSVYYTGDIASWCGVTFGNWNSNPLEDAHNLYINNELIKDIVIPDTVTEIKEDAFYGWNGTSITLPDSVTSIGYGAFSNCSSLQYNKYDNGYYLGNDNNPYLWLIEAKNTSITSCTIHEDTKFIYSGAFSYCNSLTSITIPDSVTSIGSYAFSNCSSLTSITIPDSVTSIGGSAFSNCRSLRSITIPDSVTSIGQSAFYECSRLTSITIPDSVTSIGQSAFEGCSSLTSVTIGNSVTSIGREAFEDCSSLTSITIPDSVTSIGENAFDECSSLRYNVYDNGYYLGNDNNPYIILVKAKKTSITSCTIHENTKFIHSSAFNNCSSLTIVYYTGDIASWCGITFGNLWSNPLYYAHNLYIDNELVKDIVIPDTVTEIKENAFIGWNGTSITIGNSVTSIGGDAFRDCSNLMSISIPDSVTSIGNSAFRDCSNLKSITIPDSVTSIENYAFYGCSSLTSITIPDSVTSIGYEAFEDSSSLTSITFQGTKAQWNAISKGSKWNYNTGSYTVHCKDGAIYK